MAHWLPQDTVYATGASGHRLRPFSRGQGDLSAGSFPPRGAGGQTDQAPAARWQSPDALGDAWTWKPGGVLLGEWRGRRIGVTDDRHVITLAGSRAGKTRSVLIPNLLAYPGPVVVIDPKGELARATAKTRAGFGPVHILDPFGASGFRSAAHNPFDELRRSHQAAADAAQIADALIVEPPGARDTHWTDSAKNLVKGIVLHLLHARPEQATLRGVRAMLSETPAELGAVFASMADSDAYDGALANIGTSFLSSMVMDDEGRPVGFTGEMKSILSTARQQTAPLDDVAAVADASSFSLADIGRENLTLYLVLPGMRLGSHFRWLRLVIMQALAAMERNPVPHGRLPAWFVLEEFAALGRVQAIETAAGYMAGYGVKLWAVLQDLSQLKAHYRESWETFLGNAGVIQAFGNVDLSTTRHLSEMLGQTVITEKKTSFVTSSQRSAGDDGTRLDLRSVPLLAPNEIALYFARQTNRQLILVPGEFPVFIDRIHEKTR